MKRVLVVCLLLALVGIATLWVLLPSLLNILRPRVERAIAEGLHMPARVDVLRVSLLPPSVHVGGVVIGTAATPLATLGNADVNFAVLPSLAELRLVATARVQSVSFDFLQLPPPHPAPERHEAPPHGEPFVPPFRLERVEIADARLQFKLEDAATLTVAHGTGQLSMKAGGRDGAAAVELAGVQLEHQGRRLQLDTARFTGNFDRSGLFLETGDARGPEIAVTGHPASVAHAADVDATLDLQPVGAFWKLPVGGAAKINGTLSGDLTNPSFQAAVRIEGGTIASKALGDVDAHVRREGDVIHFADLNLKGPAGHLTGMADLTTSKHVPISGSLDLHDVDVDAILAIFDQHLAFETVANGALAVWGTLDPLQLSLKADGDLAKPAQLRERAERPRRDLARADPGADAETDTEERAEQPAAADAPAHFKVTGEVDAKGVNLQADIAQPPGNRLTASLTVHESAIAGPIKVDVSDVAALSRFTPKVVRDLSMTGTLEGHVTFSGPAAKPIITVTASGKNMTVMGVDVPQVGGDFVIDDAALSTENLKIQTATGAATLHGKLPFDNRAHNDWRLEVTALETDFVTRVLQAFTGIASPVSGGQLDGSIQVRGPWTNADIDAQLAAAAIYLYKEPIERVEAKVSGQLPAWSLRARVVHVAGETVTVDGAAAESGRLQLNIESTPFHVASFRGTGLTHPAGTVEVHGTISGKPSEPGGSLKVTGTGLAIGERQLGDVIVQATGTSGQWVLTGSALSDTVHLDATVRPQTSYPYTLDVRLTEAQLAPLISVDPALRVTLTSDIHLKGSLASWMQPNGTIDLTQFQARRDQYQVGNPEPIHIEVTDGRLRLRAFVLAAQDSHLRITGELATSGEVDIDAQGEGNLVLLELIGRPFNAARGQFTVGAQVRHRPEGAWSVAGEAVLKSATLDLGLPVAFTDTNGTFSLAGDQVRVVALDGKAGGGRFHADGAISLSGGPALSWRLEEVAVSTGEGLEAQVAGSGEVSGSWKIIDVKGGIEVLNALYDKNIELVDFLPFFQEQITPAPRTAAPAVQVRLDLLVYSHGGVFIDNNVAKVEMWLNLQVLGTSDKPVLLGTIGFLGGEVTFRKRKFEITGGSIDFRDRLRMNPVLNITAEADISTADTDYTVIASVTGTADQPRIQLSADDPNLSQNDIVGLVTFGKTAAQLQKEGGGVSAADMLALLPTGSATGQVGRFIGVDQFEVEAAQARNSGAIEPRLTIGKDLTDRFRASVSSSFGVNAERLVQLEYRITRRISLVGSWEGQTESQAGAFGGDVKFRYEFRRLPFSLLPQLLPGGLETPTSGNGGPTP